MLKLTSIKKIILFIWSKFILFIIATNYFINSSKKEAKIFYAGARKGNIGGPLVKIKKLNQFFPEHKWGFNIVYLLSNSIYLSSYSINLLKNKKQPIVLNQNGVFYYQWFKGDWQKQNSKLSKIYHSADYVLWQSKFCKKASQYFLGERLGSGEILYNAVDTSFFKPSKKSNKEFFTFLITGNINKKSNYRLCCVIDALKELLKENSKVKLQIAGNIEDKNYLLSKIKHLKLDNYITFLPKYTQKDAPNIYINADAYVTMSFQDNCPSAVIEAMACGLPILYSSSGGIPELVDIDSGIGLKVSESWIETRVPSKEEIKLGMMMIIEKQKEMSQAARSRAVDNFDIKQWVSKHQLVFEKLLN